MQPDGKLNAFERGKSVFLLFLGFCCPSWSWQYLLGHSFNSDSPLPEHSSLSCLISKALGQGFQTMSYCSVKALGFLRELYLCVSPLTYLTSLTARPVRNSLKTLLFPQPQPPQLHYALPQRQFPQLHNTYVYLYSLALGPHFSIRKRTLITTSHPTDSCGYLQQHNHRILQSHRLSCVLSSPQICAPYLYKLPLRRRIQVHSSGMLWGVQFTHFMAHDLNSYKCGSRDGQDLPMVIGIYMADLMYSHP